MKLPSIILAGCTLAALVGCGTGYRWRPSVPEEVRTISVPTFRNESDLNEIGAVSSRQILRELQREGTFKIVSSDDAAIEIQGVVKSCGAVGTAYDRRSGMRVSSYQMTVSALVSVIDRRLGAVLVDNRPYTGTATFAAGQDLTTAERDASGRAAEDLARQVVDDLLRQKFTVHGGEGKK